MPRTPPRGRAGPFGFDSRHTDAVGAPRSLLGWDWGLYPEPAQHPLFFPPTHSHRGKKRGCMGAAAPPEHPGVTLGGPRSWASFISSRPTPAFPPRQRKMLLCCTVVPHWHHATPQALCRCPMCPAGTPRSPGDSSASRAFSAIDHPVRGHGAMTGLIFALQHSSAYFFEISRWGDKLRHSMGRCRSWGGVDQPWHPTFRQLAEHRGPRHTEQVHPAHQGLFPSSFFSSAAFLCDPKQTAGSLPHLVNDLGDKPFSNNAGAPPAWGPMAGADTQGGVHLPGGIPR